MKKIMMIVITFYGFLIDHPIHSQSRLTLDDCLKSAFQLNRITQISDLSVNQAEQKLWETQAQRLPTLSLNGAYTRIGEVSSFTIPMGSGGQMQTFQFGTQNRVNVDARLQFPLFTWGRIANSIDMSRTGKAISSVQQRRSAIDLTDQVLRAFYAVLLNEQVIRLHDISLRRAENHFMTAKRRYQSGLVPQLELLRAQVQFKNAQSSLEDAGSNLSRSRIHLAKVIGREDEDFTLDGALVFKPFVLNQDELIARAREIRSDLQIMMLQQQIHQNQIGLARSTNRPNLFLFTAYNVQNGFDPMDPERFIDNWNAGVQISVPIFDGFATSHRVQQGILQVQASKLQEEEIRDLIRMQVRQAALSMRQAENKIRNQHLNIKLAEETLQVAETQYENGLVSSLDVLDAQQVLSQSELLHTQAIFNHIMAKLDLCRTVEDYSSFEESVKNQMQDSID